MGFAFIFTSCEHCWTSYSLSLCFRSLCYSSRKCFSDIRLVTFWNLVLLIVVSLATKRFITDSYNYDCGCNFLLFLNRYDIFTYHDTWGSNIPDVTTFQILAPLSCMWRYRRDIYSSIEVLICYVFAFLSKLITL